MFSTFYLKSPGTTQSPGATLGHMLVARSSPESEVWS